eukprot:comp18117_c0_seq1/m.18788 comp18117_c0_seq1/g.18788  ORF comp18117_c0_seq1/g.18788 comp18117_c0_seq1/m.18788 type:complete len:281 (-) comp18117_c0_seq1:483-1325(-)
MDAIKQYVNVEELQEMLTVEKAKAFLFSEKCYDTFFNKQDFSDVVCLKALVSKGLSVGIIAGSFLLKLPQMLKILANGSAEGISFLSYFLELTNYTVAVTHHLRLNNPMIAWFETLNLLLQDIVLLFMIAAYNGQIVVGAMAALVYSGMVYALRDESIVDAKTLELVVGGSIFLVISSRLPQIWSNFRNGSTGQLSFLTLFLTFGGSAARVFTTIQETPDDKLMMYSFIVAATLNGILVLQMFLYWNSSKGKTGASGKAATKQGASATSTPKAKKAKKAD